MSKVYFTLTGTKHYYGNEFLKPGMKMMTGKKVKERLIYSFALGKVIEML